MTIERCVRLYLEPTNPQEFDILVIEKGRERERERGRKIDREREGGSEGEETPL